MRYVFVSTDNGSPAERHGSSSSRYGKVYNNNADVSLQFS